MSQPGSQTDASVSSTKPFSAAIPAEWQTWLNNLTWQPVDAQAFDKLSRDEKLFRIRHSAAHVMADALQRIMPDTQFAIGPATDTGFFYDVVTSEPLTNDDLEKIQTEINTITGGKDRFEVATVDRPKAIELFGALKQPHKLEILNRIPSDTVTLYRSGTFIDLCAGPHVPSTKWCRFLKVLNLSAAHWHGEDVPSLTRITGTAWTSKDELNKYLEFMEAAKERDHRNMGPKLDLFSFHPWAAGALWHPNGVTLRNTLMQFWRDVISDKEYVEISNPLLYKKDLFETSGHWDHYQDNMFIFRDPEGEPEFALKPMNCPDTMLYFRSQRRSYRELPLRIAEGQILHRNEATGAFHGIMRTRQFVQDDAHIFVAGEHVQDEVLSLLKMLDDTYSMFELTYKIRLSTRPESFMGERAVWDQAEEALKSALEASGKPFEIDPGEGAFYGPKIDVVILDSLGREWQCGTVQLDFQLPERFELKYVAADGSFQQPIVIHRAIFGSFDRFIGILIEHLGGAFPTWLAPVQVNVMPIADRHSEYAQTVVKQLKRVGVRVRLDDSNETINNRVRQSETAKVPYVLVVGDREAEEGTVSIRKYSKGPQGVKTIDEFQHDILDLIEQRTFDITVKSYAELFHSLSLDDTDVPEQEY